MAPIRLAVVLLPLLLNACWLGKPFYAASELSAPISPGHYEMHDPDSTGRRQLSVSVRYDGYTSFKEASRDEYFIGFAPLPGVNGRFVALVELDKESDGKLLWYGLFEKRGSEYLLTLPMCEETRSLAESVGAKFQADPKVPICYFPDRSSLEAGLKRVATEGRAKPVRIVPTARGGRRD